MINSKYLCILRVKVAILVRYFLELSYCGKNYYGWQRQPNDTSVQETLEDILSTLLKEKTGISGAGRTDSGVHARQMFAHFDSKNIVNTSDLTHKLNSFLPKDIAIHRIHRVKDDAHARFDATARTYEYWINTVKNPFLIDYSYYFYRDINVEKMNEASELVMEYTDFECFSKKNTDVKTHLCTLTHAAWKQEDELLIFTITANRFLRNMVRAIVGTLLDVGTLRSSLDDVRTIIESKKRALAGASVPAHGLYLTRVNYPSNTFIKNE